MLRIASLAFSLLCIHSVLMHAQLTHELTLKARNTEFGMGNSVAIGPDGTIYVGFKHSTNLEEGTLRAYTYNGTTLTNTAFIRDGGHVRDIEISADGTVFTANGMDGVRAYAYDGHSFTNTAHVQVGEAVRGVSVGTDGTVFIASGRGGLHALRYDGTSFTSTAVTETEMYAADVTVDAHGTVFVADQDSIIAYTYDGHAFVSTAIIHAGGMVTGLAVDTAGTVFAHTQNNELNAFAFDGGSLAAIAHITLSSDAMDMEVTANGTVYLVDTSLLLAYRIEGSSFREVALGVDPDIPFGIAVDRDGNVFVASNFGGLKVFNYDAGRFTASANKNDGGAAQDVTFGSDGTVFLANSWGGVRVYNYEAGVLTHLAHVPLIRGTDGQPFGGVIPGEDGVLFGVTAAGSLGAFRFDGAAFTLVALSRIWGNAGRIEVSVDGTLFVAHRDDAIRAYSFDGSTFTPLAHTNDSAEVIDMASGKDGVLFVAVRQYDGSEALRAYRFVGNAFERLGSTTGTRILDEVVVGPDGTVFVANGKDGLNAYHFDGNEFALQATFSGMQFADGVHVGADGLIYLSGRYDGLLVLHFDGTTFTPLARSGASVPGENVAVRADGAIFLAGGHSGMFVFEPAEPLGIAEQISAHPQQILLAGNHPNPFRPSTNIDFELTQPTQISLLVTNALGKQVARLIDGETWQAGRHSVRFDPGELTPGVYFYTLIANGSTVTRSMLLLR